MTGRLRITGAQYGGGQVTTVIRRPHVRHLDTPLMPYTVHTVQKLQDRVLLTLTL